MIAKCQCQNCGEHIEFDASQCELSGSTSHRWLGQTVECPHCGKTTQLYLNRADFIAPKYAREKTLIFHTRKFWGILVAVVLLGASIFIALKFGDRVLTIAGIVIPSALGIALLIFALYWFVCLILLPIFVYRIHENIKQIEANTRQKK
jgi:hypothetical protein